MSLADEEKSAEKAKCGAGWSWHFTEADRISEYVPLHSKSGVAEFLRLDQLSLCHRELNLEVRTGDPRIDQKVLVTDSRLQVSVERNSFC